MANQSLNESQKSWKYWIYQRLGSTKGYIKWFNKNKK